MSTSITRHLTNPVFETLLPDEKAKILEVLIAFQDQLHAAHQRYRQEYQDMIATANEVIADILAETEQTEVPSWQAQLGYQLPAYLQFDDPAHWHYWFPRLELSAAVVANDPERNGLVIPGRWSEMAINYAELAEELLALAQLIERGKYKRQNELTRAIYDSRLSDSAKLLLGRVITDMYAAVKQNRKILSEVFAYEGTMAQRLSSQAAGIAEVNQLTLKRLTDLEQKVQSEIHTLVVNLEQQFYMFTAKMQVAEQLSAVVQEQVAETPLSVSPRDQVEGMTAREELLSGEPEQTLADIEAVTVPAPVEVDVAQAIMEAHPVVSNTVAVAVAEPSPTPAKPVSAEPTPAEHVPDLSPSVEQLRTQFVGNSTVSNWYRK